MKCKTIEYFFDITSQNTILSKLSACMHNWLSHISVKLITIDNDNVHWCSKLSLIKTHQGQLDCNIYMQNIYTWTLNNPHKYMISSGNIS